MTLAVPIERLLTLGKTRHTFYAASIYALYAAIHCIAVIALAHTPGSARCSRRVAFSSFNDDNSITRGGWRPAAASFDFIIWWGSEELEPPHNHVGHLSSPLTSLHVAHVDADAELDTAIFGNSALRSTITRWIFMAQRVASDAVLRECSFRRR